MPTVKRAAPYYVLLLMLPALHAAGVTVVFDPSNPLTGPYPSDALTVGDAAQKTGRRINLPKPDCTSDALGCIVQPTLNQLDGFNPQPRIRISFSAAIDPATLQAGIRLVALDNLTSEEMGIQQPGDVIPINEVVYDPAIFTAFAKPDSTLDQHRRYALVVTTAVKDSAGNPVSSQAGFLACQSTTGPGCPALADYQRIASAGISLATTAAATVFTTQSATAWLERARDGLSAVPPSYQAGAVIDIASYPTAIWHEQTGTKVFTDVQLPFALLQGVSRIAFGSYTSPNYLNSSQIIAMPATAVPLPQPARTRSIPFNVFLPASRKPAAGYPVAIVGHGFSGDRFFTPFAVASSFAAAGWAVIAIDAVGHGFGAASSVFFSGPGGQLEIAAPGRGVSQSATGAIAAGDGCLILIPTPVGGRDCVLQTSVDLMQLTRALRSGMDLDGDGSVDLDPARVVYAGHSLGAQYGTVFSAVEPSIGASALLGAGGSNTTITRMSAAYIPLIAQYLGAVSPSLLNAGTTFNGNWPLRNEPVRVNTVNGAIAVQEAFEKVEWLSAAGDGINFAPHLKTSPLAGVPAKKVLWQFAIGDRTNPNPTETALVRAAGMRDSTQVYRADLAYAANPALPINPHTFPIDIASTANLPVALAAQAQIVGFLASGGNAIPDPSPSLAKAFGVSNLFQTPTDLPETLNYLAYPPPALASLSVSSAAAGSPGFTLTLAGSGFASGSTVLWNGSSRKTALASATRLTASINASDLAKAGTVAVTVFNPDPGGGTSNALVFTITSGSVTFAPAISPGGAVNSAGFGDLPPSPGSIASVFGTNLASSATSATYPLPTALGGVTVNINGLPVPLLTVSPQQINFQVPWYLQGQTQAVMTITVNGVTGAPATIPLAIYSPALFTTSQDGSGQGVILNSDSGVLAAPLGTSAGSRPAKRGETVSVFCTGLGPVMNQPSTGSAAGAGSNTVAMPTVNIGGAAATVSSAKLLPGLAGVYQVQIVVPSTAAVGGAVPIFLTIGGATSNQVTIAIE